MEILGKAAFSGRGNPEAERELGNLGTPQLFESRRKRTAGRVLRAPSTRKTFAGPPKAGKIDLERTKPSGAAD